VQDVSPLRGLERLEGLNLSRTPVRDLEPIAELSLQWLNLEGTSAPRDGLRPDVQTLG
jgi:hypothetical protein